MLTFLSENLGTIFVGLVVFAILAAIVAKMVRDKRKGKCVGCDCGCGDTACRAKDPTSSP
ncbi:MAG: FeoB-associated Cys-rich membrane protein [Oscillospiraceae bacterium]|nr:FeoB-associated Cys-rich membrane protein [Oscillospiraceae bacterium]